MFLKWNDEKFDSQASQKFQEAIRFLIEIFSIKRFLWLFLYRKISYSSLLP